MTSPLGAGVPEAGGGDAGQPDRGQALAPGVADQPPRVSAVGDYLERVSAYPRLHYGGNVAHCQPGRCHGAGDLAQEGALRDPGHRTGLAEPPLRGAAQQGAGEPPRDEQMARLERWITVTIAGRDDRGERELVHRYAVWHLLRRLRRRTGGAETTYAQLVGVRRHVRAAISLLDWLAARDLTLATARQGDLDTWIASGEASGCREAGHFVRWATKHKLACLDFPATRWNGPASAIDTEARWEQARQLLHDDTLKPDDLVAGLLVLLYAQWPSVISRLTLDHVHASDHQIRLHLGREPVILPEPLASLIRQLVATRRGHAALGDQQTSPWLFPGGQPGRPISAYQLAERLRQLGIRSAQSRSTALFQLATDLPAAILARMLGIHINVATAWQRASAGDWAAYAADISHRTQPSGQAFRQF